ncbi:MULTISPECIES: ABC transporter permease [Croceitalea]|uniref:ABC transporter permease n=1 Tax=Croceitalea vernalis TaxID=3075599 RepID=A0ABU3BFV1_9FLAO|nr:MULTISPECIES: ABC transporter permease [unclassified Croceitalea]MDT0539230.1 ABC transporter permease [Croceitalea sp. P059]MDT0621024.1 ABC transporter permease [Croceitalea sp. P007]
MFDIERWQEIFDTIRKNKLRTFLTGVSVASGIFILVILLGFGQGMQNGIEAEFKGDAATSIWVWPGRTTIEYKGLNPGRRIQLRNENYDVIANQMGEGYEKASVLYFPQNVKVVYDNNLLVYNVAGTTPDLQTIENEYLSEGRYINEADVHNNRKVAVISNKIKREVFADLDSPLGEYITISGAGFKIIGVFGEYGDDEGEEERIFIPLSTAQLTFNGGDKINNLNYMLPDQGSIGETVANSEKFVTEMKSYLNEVHGVSPEDERAIRVWNPIEEAKRYYALTGNIKFFFWFVGVCTIIAGVVGVSNIMMIVVKERTREIGIRKALGAKPLGIIAMILHESIFVTAISGFSGLILSMALLEIVGPNIEIDYVLNPSVNFQVAFATVIVLVVAGAIAGFFPAWRAVRVHTIDALRDE